MRIRLRHLRIGARVFAWRAEISHVRGSGDCHRCIRVRIWGDGRTSRALQADLLSLAWPAPWGACATDGAYPTSDDVRAIIEYALGHSWRPDQRGGTFVLSERDHAARFRRPGFLLTDRLRTPDGEDPTLRVIAAHESAHGSPHKSRLLEPPNEAAR
ncbi:integrase [Actinoplanes bogorensis]|uniref:Integrase n=1 Tax=Paractinoplanes bogorensis TaxID=1610840 RepID=A0ABS5Z2M2_9ACTN|nr:integrase [Actinoplanes bogorensis]MBU2669183.1 integrase [Actinoplanes bogorensis]